MLNRAKIYKEIDKLSSTLFFDFSDENKIAFKIWNEIIEDKSFAQRLKDIKVPFILPSWTDNIGLKQEIKPINNYSIMSTDGSQIYPDRHIGTACYLINIGTTYFSYGSNSSVKFESVPFLFSLTNESDAIDIVDCKRQELEFEYALNVMKQHETKLENNLLLMDGSLIFWHLEKKSEDVKKEYLTKYINFLNQFYENNFDIAGYISFPKSKELVNIVRARLIELGDTVNTLEHLLDTHVAAFYLNQYERTIVFKNNSPITQFYPEHLHPHFFYLNVGHEIVRIEIPQWIAVNEQKVNMIISKIIDQCIKGYGYPVCIAEAHEQAVVKSIDRDFFYQLIQKFSIEHKQKFISSQKNLKKRFMGF